MNVFLHIGKRHEKSKPGWNMFCEESRQKFIFWNKIWCDRGRPRSGILAEFIQGGQKPGVISL